MTAIAVIGAGLAGLVLARELGANCDVVVFEKSFRAGGRLTSRHAAPWTFDHGAQFFLGRHRGLKPCLEQLAAAGVIDRWNARFCEFDGTDIVASRQWTMSFPHYVGTPSMDAIGSWLARDLNVIMDICVGRIAKEGGKWQLHDTGGRALGAFDWVISTAPRPQSAALLPAAALPARAKEQSPMRACNALMLGFEQPQPLPWQAALVRNADISWMSVNSSKPGRDEPFSLVILSTNAWADANMGLDERSAIQHLMSEVGRVAGVDVDAAVYTGLKRWRYANVAKQSSAPCFIDTQSRLAACGDWFVQGRVEGAFASAMALVEALGSVRRHSG